MEVKQGRGHRAHALSIYWHHLGPRLHHHILHLGPRLDQTSELVLIGCQFGMLRRDGLAEELEDGTERRAQGVTVDGEPLGEVTIEQG